MKKITLGFLVTALLGIAALAWAQGVRRIDTFGTGTQVTGIGAPCTVSCYFMLSSGTVTLNGATPVVVSATQVTANSTIVFTIKTAAGTVSPNAPNVLTITPGTGFTVGGTALDTSIYNFTIIN
jgi:hypothetical protein